MHRRDFAKSAILGAAAAVAAPAVSDAKSPARYANVLFTEHDPGHWADWVSLHVPEVKVEAGKLSIRTPHPQSDEHYIVSHTVVLANGEFLDRTTFSSNDQPVSEHTLPAGYAGRVTITSTCNRHDTWMKVVTV